MQDWFRAASAGARPARIPAGLLTNSWRLEAEMISAGDAAGSTIADDAAESQGGEAFGENGPGTWTGASDID